MKLSELNNLIQTIKQYGDHMDILENPEILLTLGLDPGELYQELEMDSRFVDTHRDESYSNSMVNLHSHIFYELIFCRNTCGAEYLVGNDRYRLQKGDIILLSPGVSHRPLLPETMPEPYKRDVIWISKEFMDGIMNHFPGIRMNSDNYTALLRTDPPRQESIGNLFRNGVQEAEKHAPGWEMALMGNTVLLLSQLYRAFIDRFAAPLQAEKPDLLNQVLTYIEQNLSEKISLSDVSRNFYVSESTISQLFRKKMGVSFYRCVTQRRLISAKNLILEGSVLEIVAEQTGFSDYSTFYRAFKGEFGISPRQFRIQHSSAPQNTP